MSWWTTSEDWHKLVSGDNCPMCASLAENTDVTPYNYKIVTMRTGTLYLQRNQFIRGYCVLIAARHVVELHEMTPEERSMFLEDMVIAGKSLMQVFGADKMNYEMLGNGIPHLHAHIKPRYLNEEKMARRIGNSTGETFLTDDQYRADVMKIRDVIKKHAG